MECLVSMKMFTYCFFTIHHVDYKNFSNEICPGTTNPLRYNGSQFNYLSASKRAEMLLKYNQEYVEDPITEIPRSLESR